MSKHVDRVRRALEFGTPDFIPMDLTDIPFIYNAYGTLDPAAVTIPEGAENFDSAWCTYHWTLKEMGKNEAGEIVREDEWGCRQIIPSGKSSAYSIIERPELNTVKEVDSYHWPSIDKTDWFFESRKKIIDNMYPDRFINGFIDGGPMLVAFELFGYENFFLNIYDNLNLVLKVFRIIVDYQKQLIPGFKAMGAHMITIIDEVAGKNGLMFSPDIFREHFLPLYIELFDEAHKHNLYTSLLLDGNITVLLEDLLKMNIDLQFFAQPLSTGIDTIADVFRGKRAVKMTVDMMETLAVGTELEIEAQVDEFVKKIGTEKGGLIFQALRWSRPEYDAVRVKAQIDAMNKYRAGA